MGVGEVVAVEVVLSSQYLLFAFALLQLDSRSRYFTDGRRHRRLNGGSCRQFAGGIDGRLAGCD